MKPFLLALFFLPFSLQALLPPNPNAFELAGELLYLKSTTDNNEYAATLSPSLSRRVNNEPNYSPSGRVSGYFFLGSFVDEFELRLTFFNHKHTSHFTSTTLIPLEAFPPFAIVGLPARADSSLHHSFFSTDLTFGNWYRFFSFFVGLHAAFFQQREHVTYNNFTIPSILRVHNRSRFFGVGPEISSDFHYDFTECFSAVGNFRAGLLGADVQTFYDVPGPTGGPALINLVDSEFRVMPLFDCRLGLNYLFNFFCHNGALEVGYEFIWYNNAVDKIYFTSSALLSNNIHLKSDLNIQGPYLSLGVSF